MSWYANLFCQLYANINLFCQRYATFVSSQCFANQFCQRYANFFCRRYANSFLPGHAVSGEHARAVWRHLPGGGHQGTGLRSPGCPCCPQQVRADPSLLPLLAVTCTLFTGRPLNRPFPTRHRSGSMMQIHLRGNRLMHIGCCFLPCARQPLTLSYLL